jgi:hypothetical protein
MGRISSASIEGGLETVLERMRKVITKNDSVGRFLRVCTYVPQAV